MFQLGNTLGYYLNDIACADITGAHFIAAHKSFTMTQPELLVTHTGAANQTQSQLAFFNHLPDLIVHPKPLPSDVVRKEMRKVCHCLQFCWENSDAAWLKRPELIGRVLRPAIDAYIAASGGLATGTLLDPKTDLSSLSLGAGAGQAQGNLGKVTPPFYPLIPNVTIQYRCGDNIGFGKSKYGLLPFRAFTGARVPRSLTDGGYATLKP
ncbi:hypothetical protein B484DRAFT_81788 [Ochromonadaceae sp. CCMP2298]|nr:hypothetical protein B484DRAFT_81788 [Ochromonadaceae sp. CCMP2298]